MTKSEKVSYIAGLFADHLMIFQLFINYWDIVSGIGQECIDQTSFSLTSNLFVTVGNKIIEILKKLKQFVAV